MDESRFKSGAQDTELLAKIEALSPQQRQLLGRRIAELKKKRLELRRESRAGSDPVPLTLGQERLWREHAAAPDAPMHVVCQVIELSGELDEARLEMALGGLVERHEALRTTFEVRNGTVSQTVRATMAVPLERLDREGATAEELDSLAAEQSHQPFDFATGPLARWTLVRLGASRHALLVAMHNLVVDAWSFSVLIDELIALYERGPESLEPPAFQFLDFSAWQGRWLASDEGAKQRDFWRRQLASPLPPPLPTDRPRAAPRSQKGLRLPFQIPAEISTRLGHLGRREGATPFMTLAALIQIFVQRRAGGGDVVLGTLNANRGRQDLAGIVGYLLNVVPLRTDLSRDPELGDLVRRARKVALAAQAHGELPYEAMLAELPPATEATARRALFDVLFVFENIPPAEEAIKGVELRTRDVDKRAARFDLTISITDGPEAYDGWLEVDLDLFDEATAEGMVAELLELAATMAMEPKRRLSSLGGAPR